MSKNLNPRVRSMAAQSLISNALLLEEAAARKNLATIFSKGILRVDVDSVDIKSRPVKPTAGSVT